MRFVLMARSDDGADANGDDAVGADVAAAGFEAELVRAGVLLAAETLGPADAGARIRFDGEDRIVSRPAEGSVTGLWVVQTASEEEAIEWARRMPLTAGSVDVRRVAGDGV